MSQDFYARLTPLARLAEITERERFVPLPEDWQLVITDVRGSTQAIAAGRYKEVNTLGAASIVALLNVAGEVEIPFVFGGDGATLAIPTELLPAARTTLAALQVLAGETFGLELRAATVPAAELAAAGRQVRVARLVVDEHYAQAIFSGGLAYAESLVKDVAAGERYAVPPAADASGADLSGLECRWQDVPSRHGETVSLLVMPSPSHADAERTLAETIAHIEAIYGSDSDYHPLTPDLLRAAHDPQRLLTEARVRAPGGGLGRLGYLLRIWALNLGVAAFRRYELLRRRLPWWDQYRNLVVRTADYKKYDDTLRMILAGTPEQRARLEAYLEGCFQAGTLAYGIHVADRALMTCLVFERMGRQVHFVDGANGGYTLAAKAMKRRLAALPVYA